jgi:phosphoglycerate dehydrogenase-like enzyme
MAKHRCAILDDYQSVALNMADWSKVMGDLDIKVFSEPMGAPEEVARALQGFAIIIAMRERTPFPRQLIEALPDLRLLITTGMVNRAIDLDAAKARNVVVCGTPSFGNPTTGIAWGLILELTRRIGFENARLKSGALWQSVLGADVEGLTLGVIGLGKLALRVAEVGRAFRMKAVAWSQNITPERAQAAGVDYAASKEEVLRQSDIVSIHIPLTPKSRALIGASELALMKPTAFLVNTSRGPIVEEAALLAALRDRKIAGAGLDVYDVEPLPLAHPLRKLDNVVLTPHLGYASQQNYRAYFAGVVDDIRGFLDGKPVRVLT